jgi:itaconyl-CoA hydratase
MTGQSVSDVSQKAVANLGWKEIRLLKPVFAGDTLYSETEVLTKRESEKRPEQGIVTIKTIGKNQHGEVVCDFERTMLIWKRGFGPGDE